MNQQQSDQGVISGTNNQNQFNQDTFTAYSEDKKFEVLYEQVANLSNNQRMLYENVLKMKEFCVHLEDRINKLVQDIRLELGRFDMQIRKEMLDTRWRSREFKMHLDALIKILPVYLETNQEDFDKEYDEVFLETFGIDSQGNMIGEVSTTQYNIIPN